MDTTWTQPGYSLDTSQHKSGDTCPRMKLPIYILWANIRSVRQDCKSGATVAGETANNNHNQPTNV